MKSMIIVGVFCFQSVIGCKAVASDIVIPLPEDANTAWVSTNLNQSGMNLSIQTFESANSVDSVLEFYRNLWFKEGEIPGFIENDLMEWRTISHYREDDNIVLQLKSNDQGGSSGFLSIAQLNKKETVPDSDFPLPDGTEEYSKTYLKENESHVHTMTFITKQSIGKTSAFYKDNLIREGWSLASDRTISGSHVLLFNRKDDRCEMVIQRLNHEETVIFVNRVQSDV